MEKQAYSWLSKSHALAGMRVRLPPSALHTRTRRSSTVAFFFALRALYHSDRSPPEKKSVSPDFGGIIVGHALCVTTSDRLRPYSAGGCQPTLAQRFRTATMAGPSRRSRRSSSRLWKGAECGHARGGCRCWPQWSGSNSSDDGRLRQCGRATPQGDKRTLGLTEAAPCAPASGARRQRGLCEA